jgi:hypothetical protein
VTPRRSGCAISWNGSTNHLALTEHTLVEALDLVGLSIVETRTRFLPYTTKSRLPRRALLVRAYLLLRPLQWLFGGQTWMVAVKRA